MSEHAPASSVGISIFETIRDALNSGIPAASTRVVRGEPLGARLVVLPDGVAGTLGDDELDELVTRDARQLLSEERSETRTYTATRGEVDVFIETFPPAPLLLIFGAVHVAQALTKFAKALGFRVVVTDARATLATKERFPEADDIIRAWPDDALSQLEIGANAYIAILTHDPKFDEPALLGTLTTPARYIGAVGSRGTNRDRADRLRDAGVDPANLARIRGPIGLDIGADTPEEMAISILAEIIATRHGRTGGALMEGSGNIRGEST
ncbi:MAG: XdhC/CoxI family protein [Chloroflexota bacterium]|nr:XdhC/CoxI family protein [Chloroflexota bacterium]